jgi:transcriptional regulator with XRE-family HTH domain
MLAELTGISSNHIVGIETMARLPSLEVLELLASALDSTPALLLMNQTEAQLFEDFKRNRVVSEQVAAQLIQEVRNQIEGQGKH